MRAWPGGLEVRTADGGTIVAEAVVSDADVGGTQRLAGLPPAPRRQSMSCMLLHLGTSRAFPAMRHHTLLERSVVVERRWTPLDFRDRLDPVGVTTSPGWRHRSTTIPEPIIW